MRKWYSPWALPSPVSKLGSPLEKSVQLSFGNCQRAVVVALRSVPNIDPVRQKIGESLFYKNIYNSRELYFFV